MNDGFRIEWIDIDALHPYPYNARTHSAEQVAQIAASIREFGWTNPVLIDAGDGIVAGHGRVMAARALGVRTVPCLRLESMGTAQKRAYVIADNKLALNAGWDVDTLRAELLDLQAVGFDLDLTGFDDVEIEAILNGEASGAGEGDGEPPQEFHITVASADEAEILAVKRLLGMHRHQNKVDADRVIGMLGG